MYGAIIGDIIGSIYEFNNYKAKEFEPLFHPKAKFTDDTVCTVAIADALLNDKDPAATLREWCERYWTNGGWGKKFAKWLASGSLEPYNSMGNGGAMRVSPCGWLFDDYQEAIKAAIRVTEITHNHPEGIKGAVAVTAAIFSFKNGAAVTDVRDFVQSVCGYDLKPSVDQIRESDRVHSELAQDTVPEALTCALEAVSFEDAIRNAVSIGGDSDTIAAIAGSVAEARFGVPKARINEARIYLPNDMAALIKQFDQRLSR